MQNDKSEFPVTLGRDFSGVIVATGKGSSQFKAGDEARKFPCQLEQNLCFGYFALLLLLLEYNFISLLNMYSSNKINA